MNVVKPYTRFDGGTQWVVLSAAAAKKPRVKRELRYRATSITCSDGRRQRRLVLLSRGLPSTPVDGRFSTLLRKGYVLTKGKVCVSSVQHLAIVKISLNSRQFSFENPLPVDPLDSLTTTSRRTTRRKLPRSTRSRERSH